MLLVVIIIIIIIRINKYLKYMLQDVDDFYFVWGATNIIIESIAIMIIIFYIYNTVNRQCFTLTTMTI